jgi:hypothetical protein
MGGSFCEWKIKKPQGNSFAITKGPYCFDPASNGAVCEVPLVVLAASCPKVVVDVIEPSKDEEVVVVIDKNDEKDNNNSTEIADLEEKVDELVDFIDDLATPLPKILLQTLDDCEDEVEKYCYEEGEHARARLERFFRDEDEDDDDDEDEDDNDRDDDDDHDRDDDDEHRGRKLLQFHHGGFRHHKGQLIMCMKPHFDEFSKKCQDSILYTTRVRTTKKKICMPAHDGMHGWHSWHGMHGWHHAHWGLIVIGILLKIISCTCCMIGCCHSFKTCKARRAAKRAARLAASAAATSPVAEAPTPSQERRVRCPACGIILNAPAGVDTFACVCGQHMQYPGTENKEPVLASVVQPSATRSAGDGGPVYSSL